MLSSCEIYISNWIFNFYGREKDVIFDRVYRYFHHEELVVDDMNLQQTK